MMFQRTLGAAMGLLLWMVPASAGPVVYVVNGSQQFGAVDLSNGAFQQIGPSGPDGQSGLVATPNGSLLTLAFSGNLDSIDPATGITTVIGPTGLDNCMMAGSPCGPTSAAGFGALGGTLFATDFSNNLYRVNPGTGVATLIGPTGIPAFGFDPTIPNPDGSINAFDYSLFSAGGKLYSTFDVIRIDFSTNTFTTLIAPELYQINPTTGMATPIAPTTLTISAVIDVNGTIYAFVGQTSQIVTLDLLTGKTSFVSDLDPAAGLVLGASPVPEPGAMALAGMGIAALAILKRRKRRRS